MAGANGFDKQVTLFQPPHRVMTRTSLGNNLPYGKWCIREADRIRALGRAATVKTKRNGSLRVAVFAE